MKKIFLISVLVLMVFAGQILAIVYANHSCYAYNNCLPPPGFKSFTSPTIGQLIIEGAGYFLASHYEMLRFLYKTELSEVNGVNYLELQEILISAIANMESASGTYKNLIQLARETPYDPAVIDKLMKFDYQGFMKKKSLTSDVFLKVQGFLAKGNVTGAYISMKASKDAIIAQLYAIKASLDANVFPDINQIYRANQAYHDTMLFGQYMADVFNNL